MLANRIPPATRVGTSRSSLVPSPSEPYTFLPQQYAASVSASMAHTMFGPASMLLKRSPASATGVGRSRDVTLPSPSCPREFLPQHNARADCASMPHTTLSPALIALKRIAPFATSVGTKRSVLLPSPSCPLSLRPQQYACAVTDSIPHTTAGLALIVAKRRSLPAPPTCVGVARCMRAPSPISAASPQQ